MKLIYNSIRGYFYNLIMYFVRLKVSFIINSAILGFIIFIVIFNQIISGFMLCLSYIPETMIVSVSREEEDSENMYIEDFFWLHERGVDFIVLSMTFHLYRKLYLRQNNIEQENAWKSGVFCFLITQLVIFGGLVLCNTHLSEITLTIAANALNTFFLFVGNVGWWPFTDKTLNTDSLVRLMWIHYLSAAFLCYLGIIHGVDMHYDWKSTHKYSGIKQQLNWWDETLINELGILKDFLIVFNILCLYLFSIPEALSYELFMWGDIGFIVDVRFYGVAPHWYFRPYMAWLVACPYHYIGIFGLVFFFCILYFQPSINNIDEYYYYNINKSFVKFFYNFLFFLEFGNWKNRYIEFYPKLTTQWSLYNREFNIQKEFMFCFFCLAILYTTSYLPYGRFYNKLGGNICLLFSYFYIFIFLLFPSIRGLNLYNKFKLNLFN